MRTFNPCWLKARFRFFCTYVYIHIYKYGFDKREEGQITHLTSSNFLWPWFNVHFLELVPFPFSDTCLVIRQNHFMFNSCNSSTVNLVLSDRLWNFRNRQRTMLNRTKNIDRNKWQFNKILIIYYIPGFFILRKNRNSLIFSFL